MARRLPKPLLPVLVGGTAVALGLLAVTPSFAGTTPDPDQPRPTVFYTVPGGVTQVTPPIELHVSIKPSAPDPLHDWQTPAVGTGICADCLGDR
jgi:hypothetical protein